MASKWESEKENLENLINSKVSYEEIGRQYGCTGSNIKKIAKRLGIILLPRRKINPCETFNKGKSKNILDDIVKTTPEKKKCLYCGKELTNSKRKYCSNQCQSDYEYQEYIKRWKKGNKSGLSGEYGISKYIRRFIFEKNNCKCELCNWGEVNKYTNTIPLELHHKDGNYLNNTEENLQLLCPNCHSLTETYKSHNTIGRDGRSKYYKKKNIPARSSKI